MVDSVRYTSPANDAVKVEPEGWTVPAPCQTWHKGVIDAWIAEGNTIAPYVKPVSEVRLEKLAEIQTQFNIEANADVISNGQTWNGGIANALAISGDADLQTHRGRPEATIHSKNHVAHVMSVAAIKDVAADIGDAYDIVNAKLHVKLKAINDCADNTACIIGIIW